MLNQDKLLIKIGRNRSGQFAGEIDMEVNVFRIRDLCDNDFQELLITLDCAKKSCMNARERGKNIIPNNSHMPDKYCPACGAIWIPHKVLGDCPTCQCHKRNAKPDR